MQVNLNFSHSENAVRQDDYGEVSGSERYWYFAPNDMGVIRNRKSGFQHHNTGCGGSEGMYFYKNKFYYQKDHDGYLWRSEADGSRREILFETDEDSHANLVCVNRYGVWMLGSNEDGLEVVFSLYDLNGVKKASVNLGNKEYISNYYICDNSVFFTTKDKEKNISAAYSWNTEEKKRKPLLAVKMKENLESEKADVGSEQHAEIDYIMANNRRVLIYMESRFYYYGTDDEIFEEERGGWYTREYPDGKWTPCNSMGLHPHQLTGTVEHVLTHLRTLRKSGQRFGKDNFVPIAFFDMSRDLMWTIKMVEGQDDSLWEPKKIGNAAKQDVIAVLPTWKIIKTSDSIWPGSKCYFDGRYRFSQREDNRFYSFLKTGQSSTKWEHRYFEYANSFDIVGNYLFMRSQKGSAYYQYPLGYERTEPVRMSWMQSTDYWHRDDETDQQAIDHFMKRKEILGTIRENSMETGQLPERYVKDSLPHGKQNFMATGAFSEQTYWDEFVSYAFGGNGIFSDIQFSQFSRMFSQSPTADRNWYALRLGSAKVRIELSFNKRKKTLRAGLFIADDDIFTRLKMEARELNHSLAAVNLAKNGLQTIWDEVSKTKSISLIREGVVVETGNTGQYEWFMRSAAALKIWLDRVNLTDSAKS